MRPDVELVCTTRERLERLYREKLLRRTMVLPPDTTRTRGPASVCIRFPSGEQLWLRATVTAIASGQDRAIRLDFDALSDVQRGRIDAALSS